MNGECVSCNGGDIAQLTGENIRFIFEPTEELNIINARYRSKLKELEII